MTSEAAVYFTGAVLGAVPMDSTLWEMVRHDSHHHRRHHTIIVAAAIAIATVCAAATIITIIVVIATCVHLFINSSIHQFL